jgi:hypothetical protein
VQKQESVWAIASNVSTFVPGDTESIGCEPTGRRKPGENADSPNALQDFSVTKWKLEWKRLEIHLEWQSAAFQARAISLHRGRRTR